MSDDRIPEPVGPDYVTVELPADTVPLTAEGAVFILTASGDGKLVAQLALNTTELGWYMIFLPRDVFTNMVSQLTYYKSLTGEQARAIAHQLHEGPSE